VLGQAKRRPNAFGGWRAKLCWVIPRPPSRGRPNLRPGYLGCSRAVSLDERPPGGEPDAGVAVTFPRTPAATTVTGIGGDDAGGGSVARPTLPRDRAWPDRRGGGRHDHLSLSAIPPTLPDLLHSNATGNGGQKENKLPVFFRLCVATVQWQLVSGGWAIFHYTRRRGLQCI
jgi:hypothetical protein